MPSIRTHVDLDAPPEAVWAVLADLPGWKAWNPVLCVLQGELRLGARLRLLLTGQGPFVTHVNVWIVTLEPGRALAWQGGPAGLLRAVHAFRVEPRSEGSRFVHEEHFSGLIPWLAWGRLEARLRPRYAAANAALAAEVARRAAGLNPSR